MDGLNSRKDFIARAAKAGMLAVLGSAALTTLSPHAADASMLVQSKTTDAIVSLVVTDRATPANEIDTIKLMARRTEAVQEYPMLFKAEDLPGVSGWFAGRKGWVLGETSLGKGQDAKPWIVAVYDGKTEGDAQERLSTALGTSGGKVLDPAHAVRNARERVAGATMADVNRSILMGSDLGHIVSVPLWSVKLTPLSLQHENSAERGRG